MQGSSLIYYVEIILSVLFFDTAGAKKRTSNSLRELKRRERFASAEATKGSALGAREPLKRLDPNFNLQD